MVLVLMLLIFGPNKLPEMARTLGSAYKEFQNATVNVQREARVLQNTLTSPNVAVDQTTKAAVSGAAVEKMPPTDVLVSDSVQTGPGMPLKRDKDHENIAEIAKIMGIATDGKTTEQLRAEVRENLVESDVKTEVK